MPRRFGFTLVELLIVVVVIALMGTFATETYVRAYEKNRGYNAVAMVRLLRAAEGIYFMDWNTHTDLVYPCASNLVSGGYMQCPNQGDPIDRGFSYSVTVTAPDTFTAQATRNGTGRSRACCRSPRCAAGCSVTR